MDQIKCTIQGYPNTQSRGGSRSTGATTNYEIPGTEYAARATFTHALLFPSQITNCGFHQLIKMGVHFVSVSVGKEEVWLRSCLDL